LLFPFLAAAGWLFCLDQGTKMLVTRHLVEGQALAVGPWLKIRRVTNAQGVPLGRHPRVLLLAWGALLLGCCGLIWQERLFQSGATQLALGLALGGAGSNVYDQLRRGGVVDFLDLGWWPVFNLADVAIALAVSLILWSFL
jgi:signal peptidase II